MRIKAIGLSWFRGAATPVSLQLDCKSVVVYGMNGSGKSSFVDAVEFVLKDGKIGHLAHEYSGKRQENAIPNTHKPGGQVAELSITFEDASELKIALQQSCSWTSSESAAMHAWDYRRTVLRQDEVAAFIHDTKGGKYSALLPLLGLHSLEVAAENLRQLVKSIEEASRLREINVSLKEIEAKRKVTFGTKSDLDDIFREIEGLHAKYCTENAGPKDALSRCKELNAALDTCIAASSADQRRHVALRDTAALDLKGHVDAVRVASGKLAEAAESLIAEKVEVLQSTGAFAEKLGTEEQVVKCPACGRPVSVDAFQAHVKAERERLHEIIDTFDTRKATIGTLCDTVTALKSNIGKTDAKSWRDELAKGDLAANFAYLDGIGTDVLRASCGEEDLTAFEENLLPLINAAVAASTKSPPGAQQLSTDKQIVRVSIAVIAATEQAAAAERTGTLVSFINSLEQGIREEIRLRSQTVIGEISVDIQTMWAVLHPGEAIEDVHLYVPEGADKAIDIGLNFHDVEQDSPRLTLSEGYRNSLSLCIFLAMAKREAEKDLPIFLDDVVVSLDRNHRGMIVELLQKEFSGRQVVILTHDRDWYTELRQQLGGKSWAFKALLPYDTPHIGIRWSQRTTTFDDARAQLQERPDAAGNDARKIMDAELTFIAERLQIRLPYLRGDKNDKRMSHDFLERFIADAKCFQKKAGDNYQAYTDAIDTFKEADRLLISWANRASHTFDLVRPEASTTYRGMR